ncbi:hypothetical protein FACS189467_7920 [Bacteroidia bacterium]|nr:hypothetical protein FACS189467_7920 [Bacteroidia bacterium]
MKNIKTIRFSNLRNEAHFQFLTLYKNLLNQFAEAKSVVGNLYDGFVELLNKEASLVDAIKASDYTRRLADADHRVDRDIVALNSIIETGLHHFNPAVVEAAHSLQVVFKTFGRVGSKSYEEEAAAVKLLLTDLQTQYASQSTTLGILDWITELATAQSAFEQLFNQRNIEYAERPQERLKDIRNLIDTAYRTMTERIDAAAIINGETPYADFINQLNAEITYFNEHNHQHAKKDLSTARVDEIPPQSFGGKAVTPIPAVYYADAGKAEVELTFAKDFSVTYKSNDRPGTATLTLHGKGEYKGQKVVTFNINE